MSDQAPDQNDGIEVWLADSLVFIQKTLANLSRDFEAFRGRVDDSIEHQNTHGSGKKIDEAIRQLKSATSDFHRVGHLSDQKRNYSVIRPLIILGVVLLMAIGLQTWIVTGGWPRIYGLTGENQKILDRCIESVREQNSAYRCFLVIRPEDV